ncbi:MAG: BNR-4 repeat-containing protein [Phycisphaerae bacterium]|nr:BNR-4 repeat-containing protein [Phycisphaerae bacterium]
MDKNALSVLICLAPLVVIGCADGQEKPAQIRPDATQAAVAFGQGGQIKMLYDRRQRPQAVYLNDKVHIVFNGGGQAGAKPKAPTKPMAVTYDPVSRQFSDVVTLGSASRDHHYGPVIWADEKDYLHVLFGCHRTPGTHLISKQPASIGTGLDSWDAGAQIAPGISYPTFFRIHDDRELIYYRTDGHTSSWTYRITDDNGKTWTGPAGDVTDMDIKGRFEWSSYQTVLPSRDGKFLHVAFMTYDDNKSNDPNRFYNPRYDRAAGNEWKYNLYYVRIDLQMHEVTNFDGERMNTPIDIDQADAKCRIWDTKWCGAGVPPTIILDANGGPAFLHVLSEETLAEHRYYYVRRAGGKWKQTPITGSNHQWNSCHLARDDDGTLHAHLIVGDGYLDTDGYMDRYGGGAVEQWSSHDNGNTWKKQRDLTPDRSTYPGWKYNNIQPVTKPDGSIVDGMLLFYGWKDRDAPEAKAFLLH